MDCNDGVAFKNIEASWVSCNKYINSVKGATDKIYDNFFGGGLVQGKTAAYPFSANHSLNKTCVHALLHDADGYMVCFKN